MKKYCRTRASEDGVALVFALSMLALLLIMLIGFLASSILEQRIAYSYRDDVGSRLLVRSAMVRVLSQLRNTTDDLLFIRNGSTADNIMVPLVSMNYNGNLVRHGSEPSATVTDANGNPRYAYKALKPLLKKYFGPDTTTGNVENDWEWQNFFPQSGSGAPSMCYPEWIYYYQRSANGTFNGSNDYLTGRMAYVVVPNLGMNLSQFGSGNTRNGVYFDELPISTFLTNSGVTRLNRLGNWLSPDILLGNPGLYSNDSTMDSNRKTANEFFNFAQLDIAAPATGNTKANFFSGELGGKMGSDTTGNYREFATVYLTGDDREFAATAYNEANRSKTGTALQVLPTGANHATWDTFVTENFDITGTQADQAAANIVDYIDADSIPTSDVAPANWLSSTAHPTYSGNEKTPYINQIVPALSFTAKYTRTYTDTGGSGIFGALTGQRTYTQKLSDMELKGKIYVELINIYPEDLTAGKVVLKGLKASFKDAIARGGVGLLLPGTGGKTQTITFNNLTCDEEITLKPAAPPLTVSKNGYAVLESEDITFTGNITMEDLVLDPISRLLAAMEPTLDITVTLDKLEFDRVVLYDKDGNPVDYVKSMSVSDKEFIKWVLLSTSDEKPAEMRFNANNQTKTVSQYTSFNVIDPRCNMGNADEWLDGVVRNRAETLMDAEGVKTADLNFGEVNKFDDDNKMENSALPVADKEDEWKDLEPEEDPAKISSAYIRNGAMESIFELGLIHRGKPWQTFNLRSTATDPDLTTKLTSNVVNGVSEKKKLTYMNDAAILERYRLGTVADAPKFNVNQPANMTGAFAPLVEGLEYNTLPGSGLTKTTLNDDAKRDLRLWLANKCYKAGGNDPTANTAECYDRYVRHSEVVNVITDWALNSDQSPIKTNPTDAAIEELVAKIVPLVRFGEMYEYYTVFAVAQTIKDLGGTIHRYDNNGNLNSHTAHIGRWDQGVDMITSETWLVARLRRTIGCQATGSPAQIAVSCLKGQHNTNCTKNVTVLECYTLNPE